MWHNIQCINITNLSQPKFVLLPSCISCKYPVKWLYYIIFGLNASCSADVLFFTQLCITKSWIIDKNRKNKTNSLWISVSRKERQMAQKKWLSCLHSRWTEQTISFLINYLNAAVSIGAAMWEITLSRCMDMKIDSWDIQHDSMNL